MAASAQRLALAAVAITSTLVGCTGTPTATSTPATLSPTATATPTAAPTASPSQAPTLVPTLRPTPTAPPNPTISVPPASEAVDDFLRNFAAAQPPFHVTSAINVESTVGTRGGTLNFTVEGDVSGQDFAGTTVAAGPNGTVEKEVMIVDGRAYGRVPGGEWFENEQFQQAQPLNPFALLAAADLAYGGPVTEDGRTLYRLETSRWIGGEIEAPGLEDAELTDSLFEIFVDDQGLPVRATLVFGVSGIYFGDPAFIDYVVEYEFSDIGRPVTIEAPIP